ncbi:MAG TPA: EamA family transporter [Bacillota bacterium]
MKLALLGLAALIHAGWNLLSKKSSDKQVFLWLAMVASSVLFLPILWLRSPLPGRGWLCVVASGAVQAVYLLILGSAYQLGDLSLVYPLARGTAPIWATLFGYLFLGERIPPIGLGGIGLVAAGVYLAHLRPTERPGLRALRPWFEGKPSLLSALTGLSIAGYSVIDRVGVQLVRPATYIYLCFLASVLFLTPLILARRSAQVAEEWRRHKVEVVAVGVMTLGAYLLVLWVLRTTVVGYVSSVRTVSVVFGAILGALVLREPFGLWRVLGALVILAGIVSIALA